MFFLEDVKKQIVEQRHKSSCCRRAMLNGIIFAKACVFNEQIAVVLENREAIEYTALLIKEFFGKDSEIISSGGRRRLLRFKSGACEKYLNSITLDSPLFLEKCTTCKSAFLRGIFLAAGRMTDPQKQYRIEIAPTERHEMLLRLLSEYGLTFSLAKRREEYFLYTGNSGVAEDFFAAIGLNSVAFLLMNSKIESEFKNTANRITNCETNNILKTVSASARCVSAIEALADANLLSTLPEELEKTARMRLLYKDYSLARLAAEFSPPISKPGLSHRLNKIMEISESLLGIKD